LLMAISHRLYLLDCYKEKNGFVPEKLVDCDGNFLLEKNNETKNVL